MRDSEKVNSSEGCKEGRKRKRCNGSLKLKETEGDKYIVETDKHIN